MAHPFRSKDRFKLPPLPARRQSPADSDCTRSAPHEPHPLVEHSIQLVVRQAQHAKEQAEIFVGQARDVLKEAQAHATVVVEAVKKAQAAFEGAEQQAQLAADYYIKIERLIREPPPQVVQPEQWAKLVVPPMVPPPVEAAPRPVHQPTVAPAALQAVALPAAPPGAVSSAVRPVLLPVASPAESYPRLGRRYVVPMDHLQGLNAGESYQGAGNRYDVASEPQPPPNNHCHICAWSHDGRPYTACANYFTTGCSMTVCVVCMKKLPIAERAKCSANGDIVPAWTCPHCNDKCPSGAHCKWRRSRKRRVE